MYDLMKLINIAKECSLPRCASMYSNTFRYIIRTSGYERRKTPDVLDVSDSY